MSGDIVYRFIFFQMGSDSSTGGGSLVRYDPYVPFELRSGLIGISDMSDR